MSRNIGELSKPTQPAAGAFSCLDHPISSHLFPPRLTSAHPRRSTTERPARAAPRRGFVERERESSRREAPLEVTGTPVAERGAPRKAPPWIPLGIYLFTYPWVPPHHLGGPASQSSKYRKQVLQASTASHPLREFAAQLFVPPVYRDLPGSHSTTKYSSTPVPQVLLPTAAPAAAPPAAPRRAARRPAPPPDDPSFRPGPSSHHPRRRVGRPDAARALHRPDRAGGRPAPPAAVCGVRVAAGAHWGAARAPGPGRRLPR